MALTVIVYNVPNSPLVELPGARGDGRIRPPPWVPFFGPGNSSMRQETHRKPSANQETSAKPSVKGNSPQNSQFVDNHH